MTDAAQVFDRTAVRCHRDRAAAGLSEYDFLFQEVGASLIDRLGDIKRTFPLALDLGCHTGQLGEIAAGNGGIETLIQSDYSLSMLRGGKGPRVQADEEFLPFAEGRFDLIMSCLSLQWVNDLPGTLLQIRRCLKPDGLFLGAFFGGETLRELRASFLETEAALEDGASPHVSPFLDLRDAGDLLARAGFTLPVADTDLLTVSYGDPFRLLRDLRGMGEANALLTRRKNFMRRETLMATMQNYVATHGGEDGRIPATFEIVILTAWAPHESQQQPLRPGSAEARLADALNTDEQDAGDPAKP